MQTLRVGSYRSTSNSSSKHRLPIITSTLSRIKSGSITQTAKRPNLFALVVGMFTFCVTPNMVPITYRIKYFLRIVGKFRTSSRQLAKCDQNIPHPYTSQIAVSCHSSDQPLPREWISAVQFATKKIQYKYLLHVFFLPL